MGLLNMWLVYSMRQDARTARHLAAEALRVAQENAARTWVPLHEVASDAGASQGPPPEPLVRRPVRVAPTPRAPGAWYVTDYPLGWTLVALAPTVCLLLGWWEALALTGGVALVYLLPVGRRLAQLALLVWLLAVAGYVLLQLVSTIGASFS